MGFKLEPGKFNTKKALSFAEKKTREGDLWALCLNYHDDVSSKKHKALIWDGTHASEVSTKKAIAAAIVETII